MCDSGIRRSIRQYFSMAQFVTMFIIRSDHSEKGEIRRFFRPVSASIVLKAFFGETQFLRSAPWKIRPSPREAGTNPFAPKIPKEVEFRVLQQFLRCNSK